MLRTFVAVIVKVDKVGLPVTWKSAGVDSITVILTGDVASTSSQVKGRNIVSSITIL